jgi:UDP-N-acetylglucosamine diphosphorylase / glucose-1-phosphate thymidylyltransferase / UDP-N-acetylgalactosamine diphosphorylase / glucosamine-1-phosphate N-acetyltransferase / galactosamine-1-phosphate N-acetyltransferase
MHRVIVYDDGKGRLAPLTGLRAAFDVRTGALTTLERLRLSLGAVTVGLFVPPDLAAVTRQMHASPVNATIHLDGPVLVYNGRCPVPPAGLGTLSPGEALVEAGTGELVAAFVKPSQFADALREGRVPGPRTELPAPALLSRPWHVRTFRDAALALDLRLLSERGPAPPPGDHPEAELFERPREGVAGTVDLRGAPLRIGGHAVTIHPAAHVFAGAVLDSERGPVYVAERAVVRPGAVLIGPCYVGPGSTVLERATIRPGTAIGPMCKVNGEVGGTIFQGYSNKSHEGYVGDSWIGEWVNLGAGTTTSNLLNTYGDVPAMATPGGGYERTGERFLGCTAGDHVKTAICTRIMTGCVMHVGGMFATTAPVEGCTRPFCWRTDEGERTYRLDKFLSVARTVMARRNVPLTDAVAARISELHAAAG